MSELTSLHTKKDDTTEITVMPISAMGLTPLAICHPSVLSQSLI